ncbi:MAG: TonB-dependent siderophore receptor [Verrucomicrobia bacterium]|nr:TonB-dependent siderophore receptor [Verrucomicrobiota bacterium]
MSPRYPTLSRLRAQAPALLALLIIGAVRTSAQTAAAPAKEEPVSLTPFEVNANADHGYRPSNSVSATRIDVPLNELPITINAFTQDFINDQKARSLWEVVRFAPGVANANPEFNGGSAVYNIRGFTTATTLRNGFAGPTVLETANIARVEVVKGPSSLLYGNIQPGGVVNYITKRPEEKVGVRLEETAGTDSYFRSTADITGPVGGEGSPVLFRLIGAYDSAPKFYTPYKGETTLINPSLTWKIGSKTKVNFDYEKYRFKESPPLMGPQPYYDTAGIYAGPLPGVPWDFNAASFVDYRTSDSTFYSVDVTTEIASWTLRAAYSRDEQQIDQLNTAGLYGTDLATHGVNRRGRFQRNAWIDNTYQLELTRKFDFGDTGDLSVLFGYQRGDREDSGRQDALPGSKAPAPWDLYNPATWIRTVNWTMADLTVHNSNYRINADRDGYYTVLDFNTLNKKLHLLGGVRRSWSDSITTDVPTGTTSGYFSQNKTTPQFGVLYSATQEIGLYASYSESYQPQGGSLITKGVPGKSKVPLTGKGYDAGIKYAFLGGRLSGTVSLFKVEYDNLVREFVDGVDANNNVLISQEQSGADQSKGVEADMLWAPDDRWQVLATYAHVDPTHKVNSDVTLIDKQLADTVKDTANLWIKYVFPAGSLHGLSLAGGVSYTGARYAMDGSPFEFKSYYLADFLASYEWGADRLKYSLDLSVKNAFDEKYFLSTASRGDPARASISFALKY